MSLRKFVGVLFSLACVGLASPVFATEAYETTVQKFMAMVGEERTGEAADFLFGGNPWFRQSPDQVQNVKSQLESINRLVGSYKGLEKVLEERVGANYVYLVYLGLYDRQPVRFKFAFYRVDGQWRFQNFSFDAGFSDEVEKLADERLLWKKP